MSMPMQWQNKAKKVCKSTGVRTYKSNIKVWDVEFVQNIRNFLLQCSLYFFVWHSHYLLAKKRKSKVAMLAYNNIKNGVSWSLAKRLIKHVKRIGDVKNALLLLWRFNYILRNVLVFWWRFVIKNYPLQFQIFYNI